MRTANPLNGSSFSAAPISVPRRFVPCSILSKANRLIVQSKKASHAKHDKRIKQMGEIKVTIHRKSRVELEHARCDDPGYRPNADLHYSPHKPDAQVKARSIGLDGVNEIPKEALEGEAKSLCAEYVSPSLAICPILITLSTMDTDVQRPLPSEKVTSETTNTNS